MDGFAGLSRTGVKDLSFKMVFIASSVYSSDQRFAFHKLHAHVHILDKAEALVASSKGGPLAWR